MSPRRQQEGLTAMEVLVAVVVLFLLAVLLLPLLNTSMHGKTYLQTKLLSNMRQLQLATLTMELDSQLLGKTNIGWPGDTGVSAVGWTEQLVRETYLSSTKELCNLLSLRDRTVTPENLSRPQDWAVRVYAVKRSSPSNAVFLTSANFTNTPTGGDALDPRILPFGSTHFVVFRQGGDGSILRASKVGNVKAIGSYVPLCL